MRRIVQPELLDHLLASDPKAIRSRADLRRLNGIMGHVGILTHAFYAHVDRNAARTRPLRICELGAGDGSLLLKLARSWSALGVTAEADLIDLRDLVSDETLHVFGKYNWQATPVTTDVITWLDQSTEIVDVMFANLFLHHFEEAPLRELLQRAAARTNLFIACEPRRATFALTASHLLGLIGCNAVTRHDAAVSVCAGFSDKDLSALWPDRDTWQLSEGTAGLFSHCFIAKRCYV